MTRYWKTTVLWLGLFTRADAVGLSDLATLQPPGRIHIVANNLSQRGHAVISIIEWVASR